jgi:histidyl-tRNA synthetase
VGFGFGDMVIGELLEDKKLWPDLPRPLDDIVFALGEDQRAAAIAVATRLRRDDRRVELVLGQPKLKRAMADADRAGASRIWLLGPDEVERGMARVRDLASGEEHEEPLSE